jgi:hypothetical protein
MGARTRAQEYYETKQMVEIVGPADLKGYEIVNLDLNLQKIIKNVLVYPIQARKETPIQHFKNSNTVYECREKIIPITVRKENKCNVRIVGKLVAKI